MHHTTTLFPCTSVIQESLAETGERPIAPPTPNEATGAADMVNVDGETSLIVIRASGGQATAEVADTHLTAGVVVGAFEIEDLLVGARCAPLSYLARSFETGELQQRISEQHLIWITMMSFQACMR